MLPGVPVSKGTAAAARQVLAHRLRSAPALELVDWLLSEALEQARSARSRAKLTAWVVLPRSARHYPRRSGIP